MKCCMIKMLCDTIRSKWLYLSWFTLEHKHIVTCYSGFYYLRYIIYRGNSLGIKYSMFLIYNDDFWLDKVFSWVILVNISIVSITSKMFIKHLCDMSYVLYILHALFHIYSGQLYEVCMLSLFFRQGNSGFMRINKVIQIKLHVLGHKKFYLRPSVFNRSS